MSTNNKLAGCKQQRIQSLLNGSDSYLRVAGKRQSIGNQAVEKILFALIAPKAVGNRPGRLEPRAKKRRPKPSTLLRGTQVQARENIRKNGLLKTIRAQISTTRI